MTWGQLVSTETQTLIRDMLQEHGSPEFFAMLEAHADHFGTLDIRGYMAALQTRTRLRRQWAQMFDDIDLVLMPTSLIPPFQQGIDTADLSQTAHLIEAQKPLLAISFLGVPSIALPTHVDNGAPIGVQLIAPMHDDAFALHAAERLENELGTIYQLCPGFG